MEQIVRKPELCRNLGISPVTLWRWTQRKGFPAPIKLGPNSVGWIEAEIDLAQVDRVRRGLPCLQHTHPSLTKK